MRDASPIDLAEHDHGPGKVFVHDGDALCRKRGDKAVYPDKQQRQKTSEESKIEDGKQSEHSVPLSLARLIRTVKKDDSTILAEDSASEPLAPSVPSDKETWGK